MFRRKTKSKPQAPKTFPSGICVRTEIGHYYINGNFRHRLGSKRIFESWAFPFVAETSEAALKNYRRGKRLGFRDGSLVRRISDGNLYFISKRQRCLVKNVDFLTALGLDPKKAVWASDFELEYTSEGEIIE